MSEVLDKFDITNQEHHAIILSHLSQTMSDLNVTIKKLNNGLSGLEERTKSIEQSQQRLENIKEARRPLFDNWLPISKTVVAVIIIVFATGKIYNSLIRQNSEAIAQQKQIKEEIAMLSTLIKDRN
jgi:hypothetical protein